MEAETFPDAKVQAEMAKFVLLRVDKDKDPATAKKYEVEGIPDIRVLKEDGTTVERILGFQEPDEFIRGLESGLERTK